MLSFRFFNTVFSSKQRNFLIFQSEVYTVVRKILEALKNVSKTILARKISKRERICLAFDF